MVFINVFFEVLRVGFIVVRVVFKFGLFKLIVLLLVFIFGNVMFEVFFLLLEVKLIFCDLLVGGLIFLFFEIDVEDDSVFLVLIVFGFEFCIFFLF